MCVCKFYFHEKRCAFIICTKCKTEQSWKHTPYTMVSVSKTEHEKKMRKKLNYFQFFHPKTNCQRDDMLRSPQISVNLRVVLFATPSASRLLTLSLLSEKSYMHTRYPKHEHTRSAWGSPVEQQAASNSLVQERILFRFTPHTHTHIHSHQPIQ